jgi:hypothetical protein
LTKDEYRHALKLGLGRGIVYAREHDVTAFRDVILDACLHCYALDVQSEGTRASYMEELVGLLPNREFYRGEVLRSLASSGDDWDAVQRFHFAARLALAGDDRADGGWLLNRSFETCGEQETGGALREASAYSPLIDRYRRGAEVRHERSTSNEAATGLPESYEELRVRLPEMGAYSIARWARGADDQNLNQAAQGLLDSSEPSVLHKHLQIFRERLFPLDPKSLVRLVGVDERRIAFAALRALSLISHQAVRALAFRLVDAQSKWRGHAVDLLYRNFEAGDHAAVLGWWEAEQDRDVLHDFELGLLKFWDEHGHEETQARMLGGVYMKGPCSVCREHAVRRLL